MKKAIITVGISASGKTTWAENFIQGKEDWINVNRDYIRFTVFKFAENWGSYKFSQENEYKVTEYANTCVEMGADAGLNVIISDTNLNPKIRNGWIKKLEELGYEVQVKEFPISIEEAWKRDSLRENGVGHSVIAWQYEQWLEYRGEQQEQPEYNRNLLECILVDIDGTLAHMNGRGAFDWHRVGEDSLDVAVSNVIHAMSCNRYRIILLSGREEICRDATENWLKENYVNFEALYMRAEGDMRKDVVVKKELFDKHIAGKYNVLMAIDDRPSVCRMWRQMGLKVLQVGNPHIEF